jgi:hypothetical protein
MHSCLLEIYDRAFTLLFISSRYDNRLWLHATTCRLIKIPIFHHDDVMRSAVCALPNMHVSACIADR